MLRWRENYADTETPPTRLHDDAALLRQTSDWQILIWWCARYTGTTSPAACMGSCTLPFFPSSRQGKGIVVD